MFVQNRIYISIFPPRKSYQENKFSTCLCISKFIPRVTLEISTRSDLFVSYTFPYTYQITRSKGDTSLCETRLLQFHFLQNFLNFNIKARLVRKFPSFFIDLTSWSSQRASIAFLSDARQFSNLISIIISSHTLWTIYRKAKVISTH